MHSYDTNCIKLLFTYRILSILIIQPENKIEKNNDRLHFTVLQVHWVCFKRFWKITIKTVLHSSQRYNAGIKLNHFFLGFFYVSFIYACIIIIFAYLVCCKKRRVEKFKLSLTINYLKKLDEWNIHTKREPQLKNTIFFLCLAKPRIMSYQKGLTFFHFFFLLSKAEYKELPGGVNFFHFPFW